MNIELNKKYLITVDNWFIAPDGCQYKSVFGTVTGIKGDEDTLGIKTNRGSTNWYVVIGNMVVAGCQIHYCIQTEEVSTEPYVRTVEYNGEVTFHKEAQSFIYNADK